MKTQTVLPAQTVWGLLALLILLGIAVGETAPKLKTPEEQKRLLQVHEGIAYFFDGERMAKQLLPDPALHWSQALTDHRTGCAYLGNGVWFASGVITGAADALPTPPNWEVFFLPETSDVLFVRVGNRGTGDPRDALRRAGFDPDKSLKEQLEK